MIAHTGSETEAEEAMRETLQGLMDIRAAYPIGDCRLSPASIWRRVSPTRTDRVIQRT
jgi:hypothetical protein